MRPAHERTSQKGKSHSHEGKFSDNFSIPFSLSFLFSPFFFESKDTQFLHQGDTEYTEYTEFTERGITQIFSLQLTVFASLAVS